MKRNWKVKKTQRGSIRAERQSRELRDEALAALREVKALPGNVHEYALTWADADAAFFDGLFDVADRKLREAENYQSWLAGLLVSEARAVAASFPGLLGDRDVADYFWTKSEETTCRDRASIYSAARRVAEASPR